MQVQVGLKASETLRIITSLVKRGQHMEALDRCISLLEHNPRSLASILIPLYKHLKLKDNDLQCRLIIAQMYMFCDRYKEALFELETLFEEDENFTQTYFLLSKMYKKGIYEKEVINIFETAFLQGVLDSSIVDLLPKIYLENNDTGKSIQFFETLIEKTPGNLHHYKTLTALYTKIRQYDSAVETLKTMVKLSPDLAQEAASQCEKMVRTDPMNRNLREACIQFHLTSCAPDSIIRHIQDMVLMDPSYISKANETYLDALEAFPDTASILIALSKNRVEIKEYSQAIESLGSVHEQSNSHNTQIIPILESILERYPEQVMAMELLAKIYISEENTKQATHYIQLLVETELPPVEFIKHAIEKMIELSPEKKDTLHLALAKTYIKNTQHDKAKELLNELTHSELHCDARLLEAQILRNEERFTQCIDELQLLIKQYPDSLSIHSQLKDTKLAYFRHEITNNKKLKANDYELGQLHLRSGTLYEALEHFQKVQPDDETYLNCQALIARCFLELGRYDMTINQLSRTLQYLSQDNTIFGNQCRFLMSLNYMYLGKFKEAIQELETILEYDIQFPNVEKLLEEFKQISLLDLRGKALSGIQLSLDSGVNLISVHNMEESQSDPQLQKISFAHPHNNQGVDYLLKQNLTSADAEFNLATQMDPQLTVAHCNHALVKLMQKKTDEALTCLSNAEEINPNFDLIYLNRGLIYFTQEKYEQAIECYHKAIKLNPRNTLALLNIGDTYNQQGNVKLAFQYWEKASQSGTLMHFIQRRTSYIEDSDKKDLDWINNAPFLPSDTLPGL
jgi:tetratricopeptide (TPR) repeat protein